MPIGHYFKTFCFPKIQNYRRLVSLKASHLPVMDKQIAFLPSFFASFSCAWTNLFPQGLIPFFSKVGEVNPLLKGISYLRTPKLKKA